MAVRGLAKTTLQLGALFGLCHLLDVYNKQKKVLRLLPYPMNITTVQFAVGTVVALVMWITGILQRPKVSAAQLAAMLPMAMVHTMVTNIMMSSSHGKVAVSFTHVINKARPMESYYYLLLPSVIFLGQIFAVACSLVCVVSLAPTVTSQSSTVSSKKLTVKKTEESMDSINLLSIITVMSFVLLAPITFLTEGFKFSPRAMQSAGFNLEQMYTTSLLAALCFHAYQQGLYMILARVSQLTIKRPIITIAQCQGCSSSH